MTSAPECVSDNKQWALVPTVVIVAIVITQPAHALDIEWDSDTSPYDGVRMRQGHSVTPSRNFRAVFIELCEDYVHLTTTAVPAARQTAGDWARDEGVQLAVNGDFFNWDSPPSVYGDAVGEGEHWPLSQTGVDDVGEWYYRRYGWIAVGPGWVEFSHSQYVKAHAAEFEAAGFTLGQGWYPTEETTEIPEGTWALVSGFPELVVEGREVTCPDATGECFPDRGDMAERRIRTAMGITEDRRTLIFVVTSSSVTGEVLAGIVAAVGAWEAFNIDGGSSSTLWTESAGTILPTGSVRAVANQWGVFAGSDSGMAREPGHCYLSGGCFPTAVEEAEDAPFRDFPSDWVGAPETDLLVSVDIVEGCETSRGPYFCPRCPIRRREITRWITRAAGLDTSSPPATPTFGDVPASDPDYAAIEAFVTADITHGCGGGNFCPENPVTRAHAAAFLSRAAGWAPLEPDPPTFDDVPDDHTFFGEIEVIAAQCVTNGCGDTTYCPDNHLTRAQAAAFVARTWDIGDANPCIDVCEPADEICDGFDNDCDGEIDEGLSCSTEPDASIDASTGPDSGQDASTSRDAGRDAMSPTDSGVARDAAPDGAHDAGDVDGGRRDQPNGGTEGGCGCRVVDSHATFLQRGLAVLRRL